MLAVNHSFFRIVVESDSEGVFDLIQSRDSCLNEIGSILHDIDDLSQGVEVIFNFNFSGI